MYEIYKLLEWINPDKLDNFLLSQNYNAVDYLKKNKDKIFWDTLSYNKNPESIVLVNNNIDKLFMFNKRNIHDIYLLKEFATNTINIDLLLKNIEKLDWTYLSRNPNALLIIENNLDKVDWFVLSSNVNASRLLDENITKVDWYELMKNPGAIHLVYDDIDNIDWSCLSFNPNGVDLIEEYFVQIKNELDWEILSGNPSAVKILERNFDRINWESLSGNPNAIHLLEKNIDKIDWIEFSSNMNGIHILEKNIEKINWSHLSLNKNIFYLSYEYDKMKKIYHEELLQKVVIPKRINHLLEFYYDNELSHLDELFDNLSINLP
jgi:hypothetical protein